jgi:hypothetical protein
LCLEIAIEIILGAFNVRPDERDGFICGFFWEMWNYYSYPKWTCRTLGAQFLHVLEMPLLGHGGYVPFALELCALKNLLGPRTPSQSRFP